MKERLQVSRKDFLQMTGALAGLLLTSCTSEKLSPTSTPTETPKPQEESFPEEQPPEIITSGPEIQQYFPLLVNNTSSYKLKGMRYLPLKEAMDEVKINPDQLLYFLLEDEVDPDLKMPTLKASLRILAPQTGEESELFPMEVSLTGIFPQEGAIDQEQLSFEVTVGFRALLAFANQVQPYIEDNQLTEEEFFAASQEFMERFSQIEEEIVEELEQNQEKVIFIFDLQSPTI